MQSSRDNSMLKGVKIRFEISIIQDIYLINRGRIT